MRLINKFTFYVFWMLTTVISLCSCIHEEFEDMPTYNTHEQSSPQYHDDTNYYWYHGQKIYLKEDSIWTYNVYRSSPSSRNMPAYNNVRINVSQHVILNQEWSIENNNSRKSTDNLIYQSPYYITDDEQKIGVSHILYVKLKHENDEDILRSIAKELNITIIGNNEYLPLWYTLSCTKDSKYNALETSAKIYETGLFEASEPGLMTDMSLNSFNTLSSSINDSYYGSQWNLHGNNSIKWDKAFELTQGSYNVTIGIYDNGVDTSHSDLTNRMICFDVIAKQYHSNKIYNDHGSWVCGITSAITNNNLGIAGIAPNSTVLDLSVDPSINPDQMQLIANGFSVAGKDCSVINCSWGLNNVTSTLIEDAIELYCHTWGRNNKGTVIVFAAGNEGRPTISYPGSCKDYIISVGWMTKAGKRNSSSNYGNQLDVVAPGDHIYTLGRPGFMEKYNDNFNGTSAAAPHVTGIIALMLAVNPNLTDIEVKEILERTAQKVGGYSYATTSSRKNGTWNNEMGYGLVDAYEAVKEAKNRL